MSQSLFNKVAGLRPVALLKKRLWHMYFPVNFVKFLRKPLGDGFLNQARDFLFFLNFKAKIYLTIKKLMRTYISVLLNGG